MNSWFVARTARFREHEAKTAIVGLGLDCYMPLETRWSRHGRNLRRVQVPLFKQYLFTRFDPVSDPWPEIRRSWWVDDLICNADGVPIRIPDRQIEAVKAAEEGALYDLTIPLKHINDCPFRVGDRVRLVAGPFVGLLAEVRSASSMRRVEILFELLGKATVQACNLEKV